mgnify:CR=1 FL=1
MIKNQTPLYGFVEDYLQKEGLFRILSDQSSIINKLSLAIWFLSNFLTFLLLIIVFKGISVWKTALIWFVVLFLVFTLLVAIFLIIFYFRDNQISVPNEKIHLFGLLYLIGFPTILSIFLTLFLETGIFLIYVIPFILILFVSLIIIQMIKRKIIFVFDMFVSFLKVLPRSLLSLVSLIPVLLILTLFSVFSEETWSLIANIKPENLLLGSAVIFFPVAIFVVSSLNEQTRKIVGEFPSMKAIEDLLEDIEFLNKKRKDGYISQEDWAYWKSQLRWRDLGKMEEWLFPSICKTVKHRLVFYLIFMSCSLAILFFVYFCILLTFLLSSLIISRWSGISYKSLLVTFDFFGNNWSMMISNHLLFIARFSFLLALFAMITTLVNFFTDETFNQGLITWLIVRSKKWIAVSSLYQCLNTPNYQIWEYVVDEKKKGIANVSIVIPKGLSDQDVETVCRHMAEKLGIYKSLILITAYEKNPDNRYIRGIPGRRWEYLQNKKKDILEFKPIHLESDEIRYKHFLGQHLEELGNTSNLPDNWFGNNKIDQEIGKNIWFMETKRNIILHPYVMSSRNYISVEVQLTSRLQTTEEYRQLLQKIFNLIRDIESGVNNIIIGLCYRDTVEIVANANWMGDASYVSYKDELMKKQVFEEPSQWNLPDKS